MRILILSLLLGAPFLVGAFSPLLVEPTEPFEIIDITYSAEDSVEYLSTLDNYPVMYQLKIDEPTTLRAQVAQAKRGSAEPANFALIAVQADEFRGTVREVTRLRPTPDEWRVRRESSLGFTLLESPVLEAEIGPGTYRVEVSTPDNRAPYLITFGDGEMGDAGYFSTLGSIYLTQQHFGYSFFRMLLSSYIYYPLGIVLLGFALHRTWKYRKMISNAS